MGFCKTLVLVVLAFALGTYLSQFTLPVAVEFIAPKLGALDPAVMSTARSIGRDLCDVMCYPTCFTMAALINTAKESSDLVSTLKSLSRLTQEDPSVIEARFKSMKGLSHEQLTAACRFSCAQKCDRQEKSGALQAPIAKMIDAVSVQHIGITVSDLERSVRFYTELLGGVLIKAVSVDGLAGDAMQNTLFQNEITEAKAHNASLHQSFVPDMGDNGNDELAVRFISFGPVVIELLHYRPRIGTPVSVDSPPFAPGHSSPAIPHAMHVAFHVDPDFELNDFVARLESEAARLNMPNVRCNRITGSTSADDAVMRVPSGDLQGYELAYCKGPDGEQLEFVLTRDKARTHFEDAAPKYLAAKGVRSLNRALWASVDEAIPTLPKQPKGQERPATVTTNVKGKEEL